MTGLFVLSQDLTLAQAGLELLILLPLLLNAGNGHTRLESDPLLTSNSIVVYSYIFIHKAS